jgi:hypothetical protein
VWHDRRRCRQAFHAGATGAHDSATGAAALDRAWRQRSAVPGQGPLNRADWAAAVGRAVPGQHHVREIPASVRAEARVITSP